jgi:hypothetical protein
VNYGGQVAQASSTSSTEVIGIAIAFVVLLIGFGSLLAAAIPLIAAIVGVGVTELALTALTAVVSESSTTSILAIMIGLAVGIDYSLLIMNRYRQGLAGGLAAQAAAARAAATSGAAVCFAGLTVLIALAALAVVNIPFLTTMGLAAAGAVVIAVAVSVTLVPALLGLAGTRLVTTRRARRQLAAAAAPGFRPLSRRYVSAVTRAPLAVVAAGVIVLLLAAYPATHIRLGLPDAGSQPAGQTTRQAYDLISEGFGPGANGPLLVVANAPHQLTPAQAAGARTYYSRAFAGLPGIAAIGTPVTNPAKDVVLASVIGAGREAAGQRRVLHPGDELAAGAGPARQQVPRDGRRPGPGRVLSRRAEDPHGRGAAPGGRGDAGGPAPGPAGLNAAARSWLPGSRSPRRPGRRPSHKRSCRLSIPCPTGRGRSPLPIRVIRWAVCGSFGPVLGRAVRGGRAHARDGHHWVFGGDLLGRHAGGRIARPTSTISHAASTCQRRRKHHDPSL